MVGVCVLFDLFWFGVLWLVFCGLSVVFGVCCVLCCCVCCVMCWLLVVVWCWLFDA